MRAFKFIAMAYFMYHDQSTHLGSPHDRDLANRKVFEDQRRRCFRWNVLTIQKYLSQVLLDFIVGMQHQAYASTFRPAGGGYDGPSSSTATNQHSNASNPAGTTAPVSMTFPWSSDETALAVFQRLQAATMVQALSIHLTMSRLELVRFHDQYEVIACTSEVSEVSHPHIRQHVAIALPSSLCAHG